MEKIRRAFVVSMLFVIAEVGSSSAMPSAPLAYDWRFDLSVGLVPNDYVDGELRGQLVLTSTPVPEPQPALLIGIGLTGLALRRGARTS